MPRIVWPVLAALLAAGAVAVAGQLRSGSSPRAVRAPFGVQVSHGVVLALGRGVASTVTALGRVRALGPARDGDLSPHGRNAVLASGSALVAVGVADGRVRWRVPANGRVSLPRWSVERTVPPCCRVAYLAGGSLYAVGGDGRGAHLVARDALAVAPAWRPGGDGHVLAFATPGAIRVVAADSLRPLWRVRVSARLLTLSWRADGRALAALDSTASRSTPRPARACSGCALADACSRAATRPRAIGSWYCGAMRTVAPACSRAERAGRCASSAGWPSRLWEICGSRRMAAAR